MSKLPQIATPLQDVLCCQATREPLLRCPDPSCMNNDLVGGFVRQRAKNGRILRQLAEGKISDFKGNSNLVPFKIPPPDQGLLIHYD